MRGSGNPLAYLALSLLVVGCDYQPGAPTTGPSSSPTPNPTPSKTSAPSPSPTVTTTPTPTPSPTQSAVPTSAANYFPSTLYFNQSVAGAALDSQSSTIMSTLAANGGWGTGLFKIDFSLDVYYTDSNTVTMPFQNQGMYLPDSDVPTTMPVPPGTSTAGFESSQGRTCDGGDCHYLVMDVANNQLIESFESNITNSIFGSDGSLAIWPFFKNWLPNFRGDTCSSADAGGLMMAPMLFTAEEINAGLIQHAMRLILPNSRIANLTYVRPATHTTGGTGWADPNTGVPYGARIRLKSTYDITSLPTPGAQTVAKALQTYGLILADGGNIAVTAKSDANSTAKYGNLLGSNDLNALQVTDFEMIDGGPRLQVTSLNCVRNP